MQPDNAKKEMRLERIWRNGAIICLCGLIYFFSYGQGRDSMALTLKSQAEKARLELENQQKEIISLRKSLTECKAAPTASAASQSLDRISLRSGHSEIIFDGRVVLTLLKVDNISGKAKVQLNFIDAGELVSENLALGGSLKFKADGRPWVLVLSAMQMSSANFSVIELKGDATVMPEHDVSDNGEENEEDEI